MLEGHNERQKMAQMKKKAERSTTDECKRSHRLRKVPREYARQWGPVQKFNVIQRNLWDATKEHRRLMTS